MNVLHILIKKDILNTMCANLNFIRTDFTSIFGNKKTLSVAIMLTFEAIIVAFLISIIWIVTKYIWKYMTVEHFAVGLVILLTGCIFIVFLLEIDYKIGAVLTMYKNTIDEKSKKIAELEKKLQEVEEKSK